MSPDSRSRRKAAKPPRAARRRRWLWYLVAVTAVPAVALTGVFAYYYVMFSRQIEARSMAFVYLAIEARVLASRQRKLLN